MPQENDGNPIANFELLVVFVDSFQDTLIVFNSSIGQKWIQKHLHNSGQ